MPSVGLVTEHHPWVVAYQAGKTIDEIADEAGVARSTVQLLLAGAGVTTRRPRSPGPGRPPKRKND